MRNTGHIGAMNNNTLFAGGNPICRSRAEGHLKGLFGGSERGGMYASRTRMMRGLGLYTPNAEEHGMYAGHSRMMRGLYREGGSLY